MGLAEKRIQQEFETKKVPENLKYYAEKTGDAIKGVTITIDWASFGDNARAYENLDSVWLQPLQGVEAVCADDLGKDGVKKGLKKIVIKNASKPSVAFKDGVLTAAFNLPEGTNGSLGYSAFQQAIEQGL